MKLGVAVVFGFLAGAAAWALASSKAAQDETPIGPDGGRRSGAQATSEARPIG